MRPTDKRRFGRAGFEVTAMGLGMGPLGHGPRLCTDEMAQAIVARAWDAGLRIYDTSPFYGHGLSELRCGAGLRWKPRDEYIVSTKIGRTLHATSRAKLDPGPWIDPAAFNATFDYSYDGTMRSIEDSLQRLGLERIDIVFIHDIDVTTHGPKAYPIHFRAAMDGAYKALDKLRAEKVVRAIGVGVNETEVCEAALKERDFDCFLLAGRYTLLEQESLNSFLPLCQKRDIAIIVGGGLNSGILATGATANSTFNYRPAPDAIKAKVRDIETVCREFDVPMKAAAMQFTLGHPCVATHVPGTTKLAHLEDNLAMFARPIPAEFWAALKKKKLLREDAPVPA